MLDLEPSFTELHQRHGHLPPADREAESPRFLFALELEFTRAYQRHQHLPVALREAECLKTILPSMMQPWQKGDLLVGRTRYPLVGFSPEPGGFGFYCLEENITRQLEEQPVSPQISSEVLGMLDFWRGETTHAKTRQAYPETVRQVLPSDEWINSSGIALPVYRLAGLTLDYEKLLKLGIPGLVRQARRLSQTPGDEEAASFGQAALKVLEIVANSCRSYAGEIRAKLAAGQAVDRDLEALADALEVLPQRVPQTFLEALQLFWLYAVHSGTWNYGRLDDFLGPFLADDLETGRITEAHALRLLQSLWRLITACDCQYNNRVFIGGRGRKNETVADRVALLAIEATRTVQTNQPQLSLRFYTGQNPLLMKKALTCLGEGRTFPILYNDDVNIPAYARALGVSEKRATDYMPYGCGEYTLYHSSVATPSGVINLLKCLEVTLHNGVDPMSGRPCGLVTGDPSRFHTFDDLWKAYARQLSHHVAALAHQEKIEYDIAGREAAFLLPSLLFDDCLGRGRPLLRGGACHVGGTLESYGNINTSDSLAAVRKLVFKDRTCTLMELVAACDANFVGHEPLRQKMITAPKFGNDDDEADAMARRVHDHVCATATAQAKIVGLDSYLIVVINNSANVAFGHTTSASPDGRTSGDALANAINPSPGQDRNGVTAFLNSLVKLDPSIHAGAVQNMKFSRSLFNGERPKLEALLEGYFSQGGSQAMINVLDRRDLESAMKEPEKWGHLMVRVGGFSARFIDLPRDVQLEILKRTLHE